MQTNHRLSAHTKKVLNEMGWHAKRLIDIESLLQSIPADVEVSDTVRDFLKSFHGLENSNIDLSDWNYHQETSFYVECPTFTIGDIKREVSRILLANDGRMFVLFDYTPKHQLYYVAENPELGLEFLCLKAHKRKNWPAPIN